MNRNLSIIGAAVIVSLFALTRLQSAHAENEAKRLPAPTSAPAPSATAAGLETAVLSGGCFWGVQGVFEHVKGVEKVFAGYDGGDAATANYEAVSTGETGHAESVQIKFDPKVISYGQILNIFFSVALDPTELNMQGPDEGTQYRSEVFYTSNTQRQIAEAYIKQLDQAKVFKKPIATRVDPDPGFFPAENYHQDFLVRHPDHGYIVFNDLPKVENLKRLFPEFYQDEPVLALAKAPS